VSSNEEDIEIEETWKHMDIWKDETCMILCLEAFWTKC
jgi:hypothetical protein